MAEEPDPGILVDRLAHELKNASWALSGYTEMVLMKLKSGKRGGARRDLGPLTDASHRLARYARLVDAAVWLAEHGSEAGGSRGDLDVDELQERIRLHVAGHGSTVSRRLEVERAPGPGWSVPDMVGVALEILVQNGLEHTEGVVRVRLLPGTRCLEVVDRGAAVPDRSRWGQAFHSTRGSLGLGLYLACKLADRCGYRLGFEDGERGGTVARLASAGVAAACSRLAASGDWTAAARSRTVVYMDDHEMNRRLVTRVLSAHGWRVLLAEDGRRGLELALSESSDLVLIDLHMPGLTGIEVARELAARGDPRPRIGFTATASEDLLADPELEQWFTGFLPKGIEVTLLHSRLEALVGGTPPGTPGAVPGGAGPEPQPCVPDLRTALDHVLSLLDRRLAEDPGTGPDRLAAALLDLLARIEGGGS